MEFLILLLSTLIGEIGCDICYGTYGVIYCSGYCLGSYGYEYCSYKYYYSSYYFLSGGAIAGLVIGLLFTAGIFVAIVVCCVKGQNRRRLTGRVLTTGQNANTTIAVTTTTRAGYTQPPQAATGYPVPPPPYGNVYPPPQSTTAYPPQAHAQPFTGYSLGPSAPQYGYSAPAQPQYSSIYNNPAFNPMPKANM